MKSLCLLLSVFVLLLSLKPCCSDNDCQKKTVKNEQSAKTSPTEKECQGCSPFFTCGSCAGFIITKPLTAHLKLVIETPAKCYVVYQQPYVKEVSVSIWQPPKLG